MPRLLFLVFLLIVASPVTAEVLRVAVASNFAPALRSLLPDFERRTGHRVVLVPGSSGKHYAQIRHGAPFDVFLSADDLRPARLEAEGIGIPDSRRVYAHGRLVLWRPGAGESGAALLDRPFGRLAIANPRLAPYGRAAREALERLGRWQAVQPRLVRGENIAQAFQFVRSGNAELGFVALAQWHSLPEAERRAGWLIPESLHAPIVQEALLLRDTPAARAFLEWLTGPAVQARLPDLGYGPARNEAP